MQKIRIAQRVGAAGVIISDGSGSDISTPSFLMFKQDADEVKADVQANHNVRIEMTWALPTPDDRVEDELCTTPTDVLSRELEEEFKEAALALVKGFTPQMYIYDGIRSGARTTRARTTATTSAQTADGTSQKPRQRYLQRGRGP